MLEKYDGECCPLYNKEDSFHHCTVYKWRPLICRLFGATASVNKEGKPVFRQCKWNDCKDEITTELLVKHNNKVITMGEYGLLIDDIRVDDNKRLLLPDALVASLNKIHYVIELEEEDN